MAKSKKSKYVFVCPECKEVIDQLFADGPATFECSATLVEVEGKAVVNYRSNDYANAEEDEVRCPNCGAVLGNNIPDVADTILKCL